MDNGRFQIVIGMSTVATNDGSIAWNTGLRGDDPSIHGNQSLDHFEDTTGPIGRPHGPIEQWLIRVAQQAVIMSSAHATGQ